MDNEVVSTVPHMHLFMELKRKFPELKDADITDCIQLFGLHRDRCEEELTRKIQEHQRKYNSPWNLSRATSRSSTASRTSPHSNSETPHPLSPSLHNGSSPSSPPILSSPTTPMSPPNSSSRFSDSEDEPPKKTSPIPGMGMPNSIRYPEQKPSSGEPKLPTTPENQISTFNTHSSHINNNLVDQQTHTVNPTYGLGLPNSAPIMSPTSDPFIYVPNRRSSTETESERLKRILHSQNIAAIQEQLNRKEKLQEVLNRRLEEKAKLVDEVKRLSEELDTRESNQRLDVAQCKERIEFIQHENSRLQFVCDEMEREILESGETPNTDQAGRRPSHLAISNQDASLLAVNENHRRHPPTMIRASSTSSLSSGAGTPATPITPVRRAPSPPICAPINLPAGTGSDSDQIPNHSQGNRQVQTTNEEGGWACSKCTFENSPYLNECEMCGLLHFPPVGTTPPSLAYQQAHSAGTCYCHHRHHQYNLNPDSHGTGELQDIHIQVRHQNLNSPSKPPFSPISYGTHQCGWNS